MLLTVTSSIFDDCIDRSQKDCLANDGVSSQLPGLVLPARGLLKAELDLK